VTPDTPEASELPESSGRWKVSELLIRGGTLADRYDGANERSSQRADVLIEGPRVVAVGPDIEPPNGAKILDADGCLIGPGLVDLHTHLREPGGEEAETIETGSRAAALGGYTAVVAMPNTEPAIDCASVVRDVLELAKAGCCEVAVAGALTVGREGTTLAPLAEMAAMGVRLFTDDGRGVQDAGLMRRALEYAQPLGITIAQHAEDESLSRGGQMNEGPWSSRLGIPGAPAVAEEVMIGRDIALVRLTGGRLHLMHISSAGAVDLLRRARADGLLVTAEVTPHHLLLTDAEVASFDPVFKVNPPLRGDRDTDALRKAASDGTIDAIATDHAPHAPERKEEPFDTAPPGMLGLETALAIANMVLCSPGEDNAGAMSYGALFDLMSRRPAVIAGLNGIDGVNGAGAGGALGGQGGAIRAGATANLCVFDPAETWTVDPWRLASLARNTPYAGRTLTGRVRHTIFAGEPVVVDGEAQR
jgi:dihydroorotase